MRKKLELHVIPQCPQALLRWFYFKTEEKEEKGEWNTSNLKKQKTIPPKAHI